MTTAGPPARQRSLPARLLPAPGPGRSLVLCTAVASLGNGLWVTGGAVYFARVVGLSPGQVGLGLSLAGVLALPLAVPAGRLADRFGPRGTTAVFALCKVVMLVAAAFVHSFGAYLAVAALHGISEQSGHVARGALVSGVMGKEGRIRLSAYMRAYFNVGFSLASLAAGVIIAIGSKGLYLALFFGNAATMAVVASLYMRLPRVPGNRSRSKAVRESPAPGRRDRDVPYLVVAQVTGLARIGPTVLSLGVPLWLVEHTHAPRGMAAWLMIVNTLMVVFLQVRVSGNADTVPGAARLQRSTFLVLGLACAACAGTGAMPGWAAAVVLAAATVLFTVGEIQGESARWGLRYELAPAQAQGRYGGVFATGDALALVAGPTLVTEVPDRFGAAGWALLAALFLVGRLLSAPAVDWAVRTREPEAAVPTTVPQ
jgi:MFS family permease